MLASGNKGHVELWDIRKPQMLRSKELSKNPIVYGSRTFSRDKNILLGLENWKGVILDDQLSVVEQKALREEGTEGVVKSLELGKNWCYFGLKNGIIESVETPSCDQRQVEIAEPFNRESPIRFGEVQSSFQAHKEAVNVMGFSSKKNVLVSGSRDGNVHFWGTEDNCSFLGNGVGLLDQVSCIEISHDDQRVAVGSWDQTLAIYNV